jgi:hypothetical protein
VPLESAPAFRVFSESEVGGMPRGAENGFRNNA